MRIALGFFTFLFSIFVMAQDNACSPSYDSCDFYACIEKQMNCGADGYLLGFGKKQCEKYLNSESSSSPSLNDWYHRVRYQLQEQVRQIVVEEKISDCEEIEDLALRGHVQVYLETGYCDLSAADRWKLVLTTGWSIFHPDVLQIGRDIRKTCRAL